MPKPRTSSPDYRLDTQALCLAVKASGLSVAELERRAKLSPNYLHRMMAGGTPNVSAVLLARLAHVLGRPIGELLAHD